MKLVLTNQAINQLNLKSFKHLNQFELLNTYFKQIITELRGPTLKTRKIPPPDVHTTLQRDSHASDHQASFTHQDDHATDPTYSVLQLDSSLLSRS